MRTLAHHLEGRAWMLGDAFSIVDCCYGPILHSLAAGRYALPAPVEAYLARVRARPAWAACEWSY